MRMLRACVLAAAAAIKFPAMRFPRAPRSRPRLTPTNYKSAASDLYKPNTVDPDAPLTRSQFQGALDRLGLKPTPKEMRNLWALLDSDGDGTCTVKEFSNFVSTKFDDAAPSVAGDLQDALKTKPSWFLTTLEGTRAAKIAGGELDEIDVIRLEYDAMRTVPTEHAKIVYDGSRYASSYASRDWLRILASIRDSFVARRIASPLWILSGWAAAVSIAHRNCAAAAPWLGAAAPLQGVAGAMGYLGSALSLLLVFRTNTAYQRYWEGRQIWETLVSAARDAAEFAAMYRRELGSERVKRVGDLLCAFPLALQLHLQGQPLREDPSSDLRRVFRSMQRKAGVDPDLTTRLPLAAFVTQCRYDERLAALFSLPSDVDADVALNQLHALKYGSTRRKRRPVTEEELGAYYNSLALRRLLPEDLVASLARQRCPPLGIARELSNSVYAVPYDEDLRWTSRDRLTLIGSFNKLRACVAASERIAQTPVPLHYARHTSRFLSLYSFLLPLAIVDKMGLLTVPATAFIVWALFGLREIGTLIENPFSRPLQLQIVSDTLALDVREAVNAGTRDPLTR